MWNMNNDSNKSRQLRFSLWISFLFVETQKDRILPCFDLGVTLTLVKLRKSIGSVFVISNLISFTNEKLPNFRFKFSMFIKIIFPRKYVIYFLISKSYNTYVNSKFLKDALKCYSCQRHRYMFRLYSCSWVGYMF